MYNNILIEKHTNSISPTPIGMQSRFDRSTPKPADCILLLDTYPLCVSIGTTNLTTLTGVKLVYEHEFQKNFVNDIIFGEKAGGTFFLLPNGCRML